MELLTAIWQLLTAVGELLLAIVHVGTPWLPLIAWVAFWLLAVNWVKLYGTMDRERIMGVLPLGMVGILLLGFLTILVWGVIAPPDHGKYPILGLQLSNFVYKTVMVTGLFVIAAMCASVQLSGLVTPLCLFEEPAADDGHDDHGHGDHGSHGHGPQVHHGH